jgi:Cu(I)/Ag(I) efflux system membrane fusion protein
MRIARVVVSWLLVFALVGATGYASWRAWPRSHAGEHGAHYHCPMHPQVTSDHPGTCPICGMNLIVTVAAAPSTSAPSGLAQVSIDVDHQHLIGLQTQKVERGPVAGTWRTVGRLEVDPTQVRQTNVKFDGFVDKIFVDFVGEPVTTGQPLFALYSPTLFAAESDYLVTAKAVSGIGEEGSALKNASKLKLQLLDVPTWEIDRLDRTGVAARTFTIVSPIAGIVTAKTIVQGARVNVGDAPYTITDLSTVWMMADAYESDLARLAKGMPAALHLSAYPNEVFFGAVDFIDPMLDPASRTLKAHVHFMNPKGLLKPGLFGEVEFTEPARDGLRVPFDAIVDSGRRKIAYVASHDSFAPIEVQTGARNGDWIEVVAGLAEGQSVVTRATFLVDSESRLRASIAAAGTP